MFMFPITYLSTSDRTRLEQLHEIISSSGASKEQKRNAITEQAQIESRRKPLHETSFEEAQDFRLFLFTKLRKLAAIGASQQAFQFQQFISRVEQHMMTMQMEVAKKAIEEEKIKASIGKELRDHDRKQNRRSAIRTQQGRNPWAISINDDD